MRRVRKISGTFKGRPANMTDEEIFEKICQRFYNFPAHGILIIVTKGDKRLRFSEEINIIGTYNNNSCTFMNGAGMECDKGILDGDFIKIPKERIREVYNLFPSIIEP